MPGRRHDPVFRKILVGFDGSVQADKAAETAFALARSRDSKVIILAVARPPEPAVLVEVEAMLEEAQEHFEEKFKLMREKAIALEVDLETRVVVGHPVEQIVHFAETEHVDLIVLGRRGVSRFEKFIIGSTSEKVLRYAHCPVMVVR